MELNMNTPEITTLKDLPACKYTFLPIQLHNHSAKPQRKQFNFFLTNAKSETNQVAPKGQTMKNRFHY